MASLRRCLAVVAIVVACSAGRPATAQAAHKPSDVLIMLSPQSATQSTLIVIFPNLVPKAQVRERLNRLAGAAGLALSNVEIADESVRRQDGSIMSRQTGATAFAQGGELIRNGGFVLQPFVQAFFDLDRIEVLYMMPAWTGFAGLREFDSGPMHIELIHEGAPYRYLIEVRDHRAALPQVPLNQPAAPGAPTAEKRSAARQSSWAFIIGLAATAGLAVFMSLLLWSRRGGR